MRELVVEELQDTASLDITSASELVAVLDSSGFLEPAWIETYELVGRRIAPARSKVAAAIRRFAKSQTIHFPKAAADDGVGLPVGREVPLPLVRAGRAHGRCS